MAEGERFIAETLEGVGWGGVPGRDRSRLARITAELQRGFRTLRDVEPAVSFFGSARSSKSSAEYAAARGVARAVARMGFNIVTPADQRVPMRGLSSRCHLQRVKITG